MNVKKNYIYIYFFLGKVDMNSLKRELQEDEHKGCIINYCSIISYSYSILIAVQHTTG